MITQEIHEALVDPLDDFSPPVRAWFRQTFSQPTPPQAQGWPPIQRGEHTLILAPTGSGKTLAAFLWGIDRLVNESTSPEVQGDGHATPRSSSPHHSSTHHSSPRSSLTLLYVSPLKALNNDIERNLRAPLEGIRRLAEGMGQPMPPPRVMVRTGDTPASARVAMVKRPPHILITTPESLYLMLTGDRAREVFRHVRTVIVDEIHTLCGNKRGVHLALSLERLQHLADQPIQRIGLSATIRPLDEVARFLGGQQWAEGKLTARPITVVDAGYRKPLDLQVVTVVPDFRAVADSIWPALIPQLAQLIHQHRTTLIFCNTRRLAERTADRLNEQLLAEATGCVQPGQTVLLTREGVPKDIGFFAAGISGGPIRAHHGSMSKEARRRMEEDLKAGRLPALVGTSSLELGIDIGSIDLVVQLQSPKSVAQGLQRVGRSGHLVGQTSKGRIFATHREDVMEAAGVARGMLCGEVEETHTPQDCLDVLAQQIVAIVAVEDWGVTALYDLVRQAYPYRDLPESAFRAVLDMLAGKYPSQAFRELRPRISRDRLNDRLSRLPGSRLLALTNPGTIPDRGTFGMYLADRRTKIGELDEEFVFETHVGDAFLLGSHVWRAIDITQDKVIVADASGATPRMPFWRGDFPWRAYELGVAIGRFRREVAERLVEAAGNAEEVARWLRSECALDENSARCVIDYVQRQLDIVDAISSDRTIIVEQFQDAVGDYRLVVHSPFGGRVNGPWGLALASAMRERTGVSPEVQTNDDGILLRFPAADMGSDASLPLDIVERMTPAEARERILRELPDSALFGAQFRMNAARALLLPKGRPGKRTPFWLQRLKAKDLLAVTRKFDDFPIIIETYRDCLRDVMDLPHLEEVLRSIQSGQISVVAVETIAPSPVAASLLFDFISVHMYEWDMPKAEKQIAALTLNRELLGDLLKDVALAQLLKPEAMAEVTARTQHTEATAKARSVEELAILLSEMGDLTSEEIAARCTGDASAWLAQLAAQGRVVELDVPTGDGVEHRWVPVEYEAQLANPKVQIEVLRRYLRHSGPLTREAILHRYAFDEAWLDAALARLVASREVLQGHFTPTTQLTEYIDRYNLEQIHRRTLTLLRQEVKPVSVFAYTDFLTRWQHLHPRERLSGTNGLERVLQQLRAAPVPGSLWERDVLPARLTDFDSSDGLASLLAALEAMCQSGELVWIGSGGRDPRRSRVRFIFRGEGAIFLDSEPSAATLADLSEHARRAWEFLRSEGACFFADLRDGLGLVAASVQEALTELVMAGLVTNDTLQAMREVVQYGGAVEPPRRIASTLEAQLAERRQGLPRRRPSLQQMRAAKHRLSKRLREAPRWVGRWSLVHRAGVMGKPLSDEERLARQARQLLQRYGVVTRDSLEREEGAWDWGLLYTQFQLMEMRGEVRRGYFVAGLPGVQFALPEAVERLREAAATIDDTLIVLNACDPANIFGGEIDGTSLRFARLPSTALVLWRGQPVLVAESSGSSLRAAPGIDEGVLRGALAAMVAWLTERAWPRRFTVATWNDEPVVGGLAQAWLEQLGFFRDVGGMTWEEAPGATGMR